MTRRRRGLIGVLASIWCHSVAFAACEAPAVWFTQLVEPRNDVTPPAAPDCPFYQAAWHNFLWAIRPTGSVAPAFVGWPSVADISPAARSNLARSATGILNLAPRTIQRPNDITDGVAQAAQSGTGGILVDRNGRPVYYGIHVNDRFIEFLRRNNLRSRDQIIQGFSGIENLLFDVGVVELKSAWVVVDKASPPAGYIVVTASLPRLVVNSGSVVPDPAGSTIDQTVALVGLHVAFTLGNHREMIWATFEHVDENGEPDVAPVATRNPDTNGPPVAVVGSQRRWTLFPPGADPATANQALDALVQGGPAASFDVVAQRFLANGQPLQTPVYRAFPGSKIDDSAEDEEVRELNSSVRSQSAAYRYRLVGAVWLDDPSTMTLNSPLNTGLAGEDALSGTAMESFTQIEAPNCFRCHNTRAVKNGDGVVLLPPRMMNVSHVLSRFLLDTAP